MSLVATATACVAGALLGGSSVAQRRGMPAATTGRSGPLLPTLLRSGWWWAGTVASVAGLGLQILALALGSIIEVQVALAGSIVWTTLAEWALLGRRPTPRGWTGMVLVAAALATTLLALDPTSGTAAPGPSALLGLGAGAAVAMLLAAGYARSRSARHRAGSGTALLSALATGIGYGVTAVQFKSVGVQWASGVLVPLAHPALYVALVLGPAAVLLSQYALHRGRLVVAVVSLILVVDPVVGLLAGIGWFGEQVATGVPALVVAATGVAALLGGLWLLQTAAPGPAALPAGAPRELPAREVVGADRAAPAVPGPGGEVGSGVTATRFVLDGWPVHIVIHDREGTWRVLGEQTFQHADERPAQWATLTGMDPSLLLLPPLPHGTLAHRPSRDGAWVVVDG